MSNVVDERVVEMRFDNKQFESGVQTSMGTLQKLKDALNFNKSAQSLDKLSTSINNANFSGMSGALQTLQDRFSTMGIIGMTALQEIASMAVNVGVSIVNHILRPLNQVQDLIVNGGKQRALNIQQAKYMIQGLGYDFEKLDDDINAAVNGTRYGYDEAAMAASQLAASGINFTNETADQLSDMGRSLTAISGVASMANTEYGRIADIFTRVAGNGKLMTMQLQQLSGYGLNIAAAMAKQWGITEAEVRQMVSEGKVDFQMFADAMYESFADAALKADTTLTGVSANIRAAWKKIGMDFWNPIVENNSTYVKALGKFKDLVNKFIRPVTKAAAEGGWTDFVNTLAEGLDAFLSYQPFLNGVKSTVQGVVDAISSLNINDKVKSAFGFIENSVKQFESFKNQYTAFTDVIEKDLAILRVSGENYVEAFSKKWGMTQDQVRKILEDGKADITDFKKTLLGMSATTKNGLDSAFNLDGAERFDKIFFYFERFSTIFQGMKSGFHIFTSFLSAVGKGFATLAKHIFPAAEGFTNLGATIAENVTALDNWLTENDIFNKAIEKMDEYLGPVIDFIVEKFNAFADALHRSGPKFEDFKRIFSGLYNGVSKFFNGIKDVFSQIIPFLKQGIEWLSDALGKAAAAVGDFLSNLDLSDIGNIAAGGGAFAVLGVIAEKLWAFVKTIGSGGAGGGLFSQAIKAFGLLRETLMEYQLNLKADVLIKIAEAVGILAASLFVLSLVDADKLWSSVGALGAIMAEFAAFLAAFAKIGEDTSSVASGGGPFDSLINNITKTFTKIGNAANKIGTGVQLIAIAGAILILAAAVKKLGEINTADVIQGLIAIEVLFKELEIFLKKVNLEKLSANQGIGVLLIAAALLIMANAVKSLGNVPIGELVKGLAAVGVLLYEISMFTKKLSIVQKDYISAGVGMIALATSLLIMSKAIQSMGQIPAEQLGQGLVGIALSLTAMVTAMNLLDFYEVISKSASLVIFAGAMIVMAKAVEMMGKLPVEQMGQGLVGIGLALAGMVTALNMLNNGLDEGSVMVKASAILVLAGAMNVMSWAIQSLGNMNLWNIVKALIAFGGVLGIIVWAGPALTFAAEGMLALGGAMLMFGAGIALIGGGIFLIGAGLVSLATGITALGGALAVGGVEIVAGITAIVSGIIAGIAAAASALAAGVITFLVTLGNGAAQLVQVVVQLGTAVIQGIVELLPQIVDLILLIISEVLRIVVEAAPQIVLAAAQLMVAFIEGITEKIPEIVNAAFNLIIVFIDSMTLAINEHGSELVNSFSNLIAAVIHFLAEAAFQFLWAAIEWIGQLVIGIVDGISDVVSGFSDLVNQAVDAVVNFASNFFDAGKNLVEGLISGVASMVGDFVGTIAQMATDGWNAFTNLFGIESPSKLMKWGGKMLIKGLVKGVDGSAKDAVNSIEDLGNSMYSAFEGIMDTISGDVDLNPTITPVMDLSAIQSGAATLNGMFGTTDLSSSLTVGARIDNVGAIASINSKWNPYGDEDVVNSIDKLHNDISDLNTRIEEMNEKDATYEFNLNTQLDGRNIARSTARYNRQELALLDRNTNRKGGKVR